MATAVTGTFVATGNSAGFAPEIAVSAGSSRFNVTVFGTFVGTVVIERSFDSGTTFVPVLRSGTAVSYTVPSTEVFEEPEAGVQWRVRCSAFTSGTISYRLSN
jgi:hypothetical protein